MINFTCLLDNARLCAAACTDATAAASRAAGTAVSRILEKLCADPLLLLLLLLLLRVVPRTAYLHTAALADLLSGAS